MARRSDHNREELYEMAIAAAIEIVEKDGFRALTARNVADKIGYSAGTLYNVFENLDDIIVHLNGRTLDRLHDQLSNVSTTGNATEDISSLVDIYLTFLDSHPNLWMALFDYKLPAGHFLPDWYAPKISLVMGIVEAALTPLFKDAEQIEKENTARILWASLHGICTLSQSGKLQIVTSQTVKQMAHTLVHNFVTGLSINNPGVS